MLNGGLFWFAMGILFVLVAWAFKAFADDRGWQLSWWKCLLAILWYAILSLSFFAWGPWWARVRRARASSSS